MTFPNGTHVVEVEIDRDTGAVSLVRHSAVDDYGVLVNPMVAAGQVHGAIAQGAGQALLEQAVHDPASGQLLTGSFMDYALPRADDLPAFELDFNPTRCTTNPLGVKGCGEAAAVAMLPAIRAAVLDALAPFGVTAIRRSGDAGADLAGDAGGVIAAAGPVRHNGASRCVVAVISGHHIPPGQVFETFQNTGTAPFSGVLILLRQPEGGKYWPSGMNGTFWKASS